MSTDIISSTEEKIAKEITKPIIYTEEFVKKELEAIYSEALQNTDYVVLGELFEKRAYSSQRFSEWAEKFKNNEEISESIKKIKDLFENRVNVGGLKGKLNAAMCIFNLKNNYGWKDKTEQDMNIKSVSLSEMFDELTK